MESYEESVDLALMVVDLERSTYKLMMRSGLKNYSNQKYLEVIKKNNEREKNIFILSAKILLNDLQSFVVNCSGNNCLNNCMQSKCDTNIKYTTPTYMEALIDPSNVVNQEVTRYKDGFNPQTWNTNISRLTQPLDTLKLYRDHNNESLQNYGDNTGYGPQAWNSNAKTFDEKINRLNGH